MSNPLLAEYFPFILLSLFFFFISFVSMRAGLVLLVIAMLFSPEFSVGAVGVRTVTIRIEDVLIPILMISWLAQNAVKRQETIFMATPLNVPILALLGLTLLSTLRGIAAGWVPALTAFFYIFKTLQFFVIFYLVANSVKTARQIRIYLWFMILTLALIGLYTLKQVPSVQIFTEHRITAPFEGAPEPATVGGYMAFLLLIVFSLYLYEKKGFTRVILAGVGLMVLIPFVYTLNRTSYAALIVGMLFISFVQKRKWMTVVILGGFIILPFLIPALGERIAFTWRDAANPGRDYGVDMSLGERIYSFKKMWQTARTSPLIGWGVASFLYPDNQYARTLHEIGIIGLGFWLWIFTRLIKISRWLFYSLEGGLLKGLALGYWAGVIGILMHGFGAITFYIVRIMEPFWFVSGLVMALYMIQLRALPAEA